MPLVRAYFELRDNIFLNTSAAEGNFLERAGNFILTPAQFLLSGKTVQGIRLNKEESLEKLGEEATSKYTFHYDHPLILEVLKTTVAIIALIPSLIIGAAFKGLAYLSATTRFRHQVIEAHFSKVSTETIKKTHQQYVEKGLVVTIGGSFEQIKPVAKPRLGDEGLTPKITKTLKSQKVDAEALEAIFTLLRANNIPCWVDWGTLLGVYRHNGIIPWDLDIDLAILAPDHENVERILRGGLDRDKYQLMDFSPASNRDSLFKVLVKKTGMLIDIYHYDITEDARGGNCLTYNFSHVNESIIPEEAKKREVPQTKNPLPAAMIFPLKEASFDGVPVLVPNKIEEYLMEKYVTKPAEGERELSWEEKIQQLSPCRVWSEATQTYEKVEDHPFWKQCAYNY